MLRLEGLNVSAAGDIHPQATRIMGPSPKPKRTMPAIAGDQHWVTAGQGGWMCALGWYSLRLTTVRYCTIRYDTVQ